MKKISVCIPMYNESAVIGDSARKLHEYLESKFPDSYELIFCDDGSRDGSADIVNKLELSNTRVISYGTNRGKGYAVRKALYESTGDYALFTDADLAYGTDVIGRFYDVFESDPEVGAVIGSRNLSSDGYKNYPFLRKVFSKVYIKVLCFVGGFKLSDSQCGCKAFTRDLIDRVVPKCTVDRFAFDFEIIMWAQKMGFYVAECPVSVLHFGESKVNIIKDTIKMLLDLIKMRIRINKD